MFTQLELKCLNIFLKLVTKSPACPYDYRNGKLVRTRSGYKAYIWRAYIVAINTWLLISLVQLKRTISEAVFPDVVFNCVLLCVLMSTPAFQLSLWLYGDELAEFVNGTQQMNREFRLRYKGTFIQPENKIREKVFLLALISFGVAAIFFAGFLLATRNFSFSIYYIMWHDLNQCHIYSFILFLALTFMLSTEILPTSILQVVGVYHITSTIFWLKEACIEWPKADVHPQASISVSKSCYLMTKKLNNGFGKLFIPTMKLILIYVILTGMVGLICYSDKLDWISIITSVIFTASALVIITPGAVLMSRVYKVSSQFGWHLGRRIQKIEDPVVRRQWTKELRACQIIRCSVGSFYYMESEAKLTLAQYLINGVVFLILD